jgi:hypothetical protein
VRQLIVPQTDTVVSDVVETWQAGNSAPILFEADVPSNTPVNDIIYIQFNPYGWTEPIPMWPIGNNRWVYKLYSPLSILGSFGYRYCRAGQCGYADDAATASDAARGRQVASSVAPQDIKDTVEEWVWLGNTQPGNLVGSPVSPRQGDFLAGVEFLPTQHPNWVTAMSQAMQNTRALGSNWVVLTPTWTFGNSLPLVVGPTPGKDSFWNDTYRMVSQAREMNMNVALFPTPRFNTDAEAFWASAPKDADWWQTWFNHYRAFVINYADLATQSGAQILILGGDWLEPALPNNGAVSGALEDAETRWKTIISEARRHFQGDIYWALPFEQETVDLPLDVLADTDGIYLLWTIALSDSTTPTETEMTAEAGRLLDTSLSPLSSTLGKPVVLALAYPSANGAASGCLPDGQGGCLPWRAFSPPNVDITSVYVDMQLQADIYESVLNAVNDRPWVAGFVSRGYYPPTILQDKSASVRGKPAADLLWYWYPRFLGTAQ